MRFYRKIFWENYPGPGELAAREYILQNFQGQPGREKTSKDTATQPLGNHHCVYYKNIL